jgi:hypothetical protein
MHMHGCLLQSRLCHHAITGESIVSDLSSEENDIHVSYTPLANASCRCTSLTRHQDSTPSPSSAATCSSLLGRKHTRWWRLEAFKACSLALPTQPTHALINDSIYIIPAQCPLRSTVPLIAETSMHVRLPDTRLPASSFLLKCSIEHACMGTGARGCGLAPGCQLPRLIFNCTQRANWGSHS